MRVHIEIFDQSGHVARKWNQNVNDVRHAENLAKKMFRENPNAYQISVNESNGCFQFGIADNPREIVRYC